MTNIKVAAVLDANGVVINRIVVDQIPNDPDIVDGEFGSIGDTWDGKNFITPPPPPPPVNPAP